MAGMTPGKLTQCHFDLVHTLRKDRSDVGIDFLTVNNHLCNALADVIRVLHRDLVSSTAELTGSFEASPCARDARIDNETVETCADTEDGCSLVSPSRSTGEPCVTAHTELLVFVTEDVLRIAVRFRFEHVEDAVLGSRVDLVVVLECVVATAEDRFGNHHPRVRVEEDTAGGRYRRFPLLQEDRWRCHRQPVQSHGNPE